MRDGARGAVPSPGLRGEVSERGVAAKAALGDVVRHVFRMGRWACHHDGCPRSYPHARMLVGHLMDVHGEFR